LEQADAVVVNSVFLRDMFVALGYPEDRLHVVHLGVDDSFLRFASGRRDQSQGPLRLMFAGRFDRAKGADVLIEALSRLGRLDWELVIAGPVGSEIRSLHPEFLADQRVSLLGTIDRAQLALEMKRAPVFVFPSPSEGSARVIFEALACGCYVITTPTAGSIVEDGVHGALVAPGDPGRLADAIAQAAGSRELLAELGRRNAQLIAREFTQSDYGQALAGLYDRLGSQASRRAQRSTFVAPNSG
jgi:glycosyltransferase involved in cell wall biosynthesis